jgi:hypothetical protein
MNSSQIQGGADMKAKYSRLVISCLALAALVVAAAPAYAAGGVAFQASSLPVQVRGEGLTETIGAVVLQATGPGSITSGSSITVVYSGAITNSGSFSGTSTAGLSCSGTGTVGAGACTGLTTAASGSQLTVSFGSTSPTYTFSAGDYIEISQVRVNVNALGSAASTVTATLSGTSSSPTTNPITFTQSQVGVASIVNPSVKASVASTASTIQTCNIPTGSGSSANTFSVKVTENYPAALTSVTDESNFTPITTVANGSLVNVTINNLPTGFGVSFATQTAGGTSAIVLTPTSASASSPTVSTGSAITYIFSVSGDSTSAIDSTTLTFDIGYTNGKSSPTLSGSSAAALGTVVNVTATVSLGPSSGIVSFATNNEGGGTVATLGDCVTNLLFPFSTNQVGFDTNIQISNTSLDKLAFPSGGAAAQSGTCTLTYYPTDLTTQTSSAAGNQGTPSQFTTPIIPAGGAYSFAQSTSTFKGQSGYMFAVCRFLDAHGFSFVVNGTPTTGTISQGLLALVIPNSSIATGRLANPSATCTPAVSACSGTSCSNGTPTCTVNQGITFATGGNWEGLVH